MKKKIIFILSFLFILFSLTSCKSPSNNLVGLWLLNEGTKINTDIHTKEEIEELRNEYGITLYVDGYTEDKVVDHLEGKNPYSTSLYIYANTPVENRIRIVLVYQNDEGYYLKDRNNGYPHVLKSNIHYDYKIKNYSVTIFYYYVDENV